MHMDESCHTHMDETCHTHMDESRHTHMDESCHRHMDESCHTHKCIGLVHAFTESHISPFAHVCTRSRARTARVDYWLGMFTRIICYGVATMSRLLHICKRALSKRRYSAEETYNLKEPTNRSPPYESLVTHCKLLRARVHALARSHSTNACVCGFDYTSNILLVFETTRHDKTRQRRVTSYKSLLTHCEVVI